MKAAEIWEGPLYGFQNMSNFWYTKSENKNMLDFYLPGLVVSFMKEKNALN